MRTISGSPFNPTNSNAIGTSSEIVQILDAYHRPMPVRFIADKMNMPVSELKPKLARLETEGIVRIEKGRIVTLVPR